MAEANPNSYWISLGWTNEEISEGTGETFVDEADFLNFLAETMDDWLDEISFGPYE